MGAEAAEKNVEATARLIAAGRALLAQGDERFSLSRLCAEAGVTLADFRASFTSRAELLQQLTEMPGAETAPEPRRESSQEKPQADPWLERRLRVFERAVNSLEERAEQRDREYRQGLARLEEKLSTLGGMQLRLEVAEAARAVQVETPEEAHAATPSDETAAAVSAPEEAEDKAEPNPLLLGPLQPEPVQKVDAEFLESARRAARAHGRALEGRRKSLHIPTRMLVRATLAILLLLACAALTLVYAGGAHAGDAPSGGAVAYRAPVASPLTRLTARADNGDVAAQSALAFAYLRGEGAPKDMEAAARWAEVAARGGDPEAEYLFASLSRSGTGMAADAKAAFTWFARAADAGNIKAMHNLGLAYAEGQGTAKDEAAAATWFAKAAARGYVDAAFNLAVLYERGQGVAQNPREALRWYRVAAKSGDTQAAARARQLARQVRL